MPKTIILFLAFIISTFCFGQNVKDSTLTVFNGVFPQVTFNLGDQLTVGTKNGKVKGRLTAIVNDYLHIGSESVQFSEVEFIRKRNLSNTLGNGLLISSAAGMGTLMAIAPRGSDVDKDVVRRVAQATAITGISGLALFPSRKYKMDNGYTLRVNKEPLLFKQERDSVILSSILLVGEEKADSSQLKHVQIYLKRYPESPREVLDLGTEVWLRTKLDQVTQGNVTKIEEQSIYVDGKKVDFSSINRMKVQSLKNKESRNAAAILGFSVSAAGLTLLVFDDENDNQLSRLGRVVIAVPLIIVGVVVGAASMPIQNTITLGNDNYIIKVADGPSERMTNKIEELKQKELRKNTK